MTGDVNPSGKTVDEWTRDLTNDPTFANVNTTSYTGTSYNGIDYEEDIYLGYKYYETYWYENQSKTVSIPGLSEENATAQDWYDYNVVYPFGYGLSYTQFSYALEGVTANYGSTAADPVKGDELTENQSFTASQFTTSTAASLETAITSMTAEVENNENCPRVGNVEDTVRMSKSPSQKAQ